MPGSTPANQPARLAHLDDGNDRAILVQGHEGPAQIVRLGHRGTPSIDVSDEIAILAARPIRTFRPFLDQCLSELVEPRAETICAPERSFSVAGPIVRVRHPPPLNLSLSGVGEEPSVRSQPEEKRAGPCRPSDLSRDRRQRPVITSGSLTEHKANIPVDCQAACTIAIAVVNFSELLRLEACPP